jgi:hypothetical protein
MPRLYSGAGELRLKGVYDPDLVSPPLPLVSLEVVKDFCRDALEVRLNAAEAGV